MGLFFQPKAKAPPEKKYEMEKEQPSERKIYVIEEKTQPKEQPHYEQEQQPQQVEENQEYQEDQPEEKREGYYN